MITVHTLSTNELHYCKLHKVKVIYQSYNFKIQNNNFKIHATFYKHEIYFYLLIRIYIVVNSERESGTYSFFGIII